MKRFTDTNKWEKNWFRKLPPEYKCFWFYLTEHCDGAGVWEPDFELVYAFIGKEIQQNVALDLLNNRKTRVTVLDNGDWYIPEFISFQCGELSDTCPAHKPIFKLLKKHNLPDRVANRVSNTLQEKEKEKDQDKDKEKEKTRFFVKPSLEEIEQYIKEQNYNVEPDNFLNFYESKGWKVGNQAMKDWKACVRTWQSKDKNKFLEQRVGKQAVKNMDSLKRFNEKMDAKNTGVLVSYEPERIGD